ncbi:MAG TPA: NAD(+) kinase [Gammaproteobacteria bacterium]|jgi:NAD+ kinase|nr:NAD(+) kinase [Gammaproteobacteria bacterium]
MASQFKVVGIYGRTKNQDTTETLGALVAFLRSLDQEILIDDETAEVLDDPDLTRVSRTELSKRCQLLIVVGGDGSLLHAVHAVINEEIPVLGINRGRLGFLTDILPQELNKIKAILEGHFILEKRFLLAVTIEHEGKVIGQSSALNETTLIPYGLPHMNEFEIHINDKFLCSQHSDGVIVATPTGSTAYALSGGGPILHPALDAMVIVPMFPHTLSMRPIVIEGNQHIKIVVSARNTVTPCLTCDGQAFMSDAPPGSHIHIKKKPQRLHLIHPTDYDYYEGLRSKLHWGRKPC